MQVIILLEDHHFPKVVELNMNLGHGKPFLWQKVQAKILLS